MSIQPNLMFLVTFVMSYIIKQYETSAYIAYIDNSKCISLVGAPILWHGPSYLYLVFLRTYTEPLVKWVARSQITQIFSNKTYSSKLLNLV